MPSQKIKNCPFCGGIAKHVISKLNFGKNWGSRETYLGIKCINKECPVKPMSNAINEDREKTIEAWNTRSNDNG